MTPTTELLHPCPICEEAGKSVETELIDTDQDGFNISTPYFYCRVCCWMKDDDEEPEGCNDFDM